MISQLSLKAAIRTLEGKKLKRLREQNKLPAVIYGHGIKSQPLEVEYLLFKKIYEKAGESTLIDLHVDEQKPVKVLIQAVQLNPVTDQYLHVDFHQVKMTEKMTAEVPLKFVGESPAVKEQGGILVKNLDKVKIECLPDDLIHEIEVDLSSLKDFNSTIHVRELNIPPGVSVLDKPEETVVLIEPPRSEEELKELEEKPVVPVTEEVAEEKPTEGEAPAEEKEEGRAPQAETKEEKPKEKK